MKNFAAINIVNNIYTTIEKLYFKSQYNISFKYLVFH